MARELYTFSWITYVGFLYLEIDSTHKYYDNIALAEDLLQEI